MAFPELSWLPKAERFRERLAALGHGGDVDELLRLAGSQLDFLGVNALDAAMRRRWTQPPPALRALRLAILSSSTTAHLAPGLRIAGLRAGLWLEVHEGDYGQYRQALEDPASSLHAFRPEAVLFAFDAERLAAGVNAADPAEAVEAALAALKADFVALWGRARKSGALVLQQTALPSPPTLIGANEHRLPGSRAGFIARLNIALRGWADAEGVDLVALDAAASRDGARGVARSRAVGARQAGRQTGRRADVRRTGGQDFGGAAWGAPRKCLALDLDNTLWGGVVGDDGLDGIVLGQGSPLGEGFLAVQLYARELSRSAASSSPCARRTTRPTPGSRSTSTPR